VANSGFAGLVYKYIFILREALISDENDKKKMDRTSCTSTFGICHTRSMRRQQQ